MPENPQSTRAVTTDEGGPAVPDDAAQEPSLDDLLKPPPDYKPFPKWDDPELRYAPRGADSGQPRVTPDEAWRKINALVEKYDKGLCESYREQIDTLLVFAGLFSAVVTAFTIDSYKWLQDDPTETSAELLRQAVSLLSALANQTVPATSPQGASLPGSAVVRINIYWFLSLVLSLSAALVGIVCKQWLREYERDVSRSAQTALRVRQMKFEGLEYWHVGGIVTCVPLLLQVALALFLLGVSELLWHLHRTVAIAVTTVAGLTAAFYLVTALLPLAQYLSLRFSGRFLFWNLRWSAFTVPQCPYKSPQAWIVLRLCRPIVDYILKYRNYYKSPDSWITFDRNWAHIHDSEDVVVTTTFRALAWADYSLGESHLSAWIFLCAWEEFRSHKRDLALLIPSLETLRVNYVWDPDCDHQNLSSWTRAQACLLGYSFRKRLGINLSMELLLQLIHNSPFHPAWYGSYLDTVHEIFYDQVLDNDLAFELVRSLDAVLIWDSGYSDIHMVPYLLMLAMPVAARAPTGAAILLPAIYAILLKWLRTFPSGHDTQRAEAARYVLYYLANDRNLSQVPSEPESRSCHIAAVARFMLETVPQIELPRSVQGMLDRLGLDSLYKNRPSQSQQVPAREGALSDTEPGTVDVQATHPIPDPGTSLPHVALLHTSSIDTGRSLSPAHVEISIRTRETVPYAADVAMAVTTPSPTTSTATQRHAAGTLPPPVARGDSSLIDSTQPSPHAYAEIDMDMRESMPDAALADEAVTHSTPTSTQPKTEMLSPLVTQSVTESINARKPPPQTEPDIEIREPVPDAAADVAVAHPTPTTQPRTETLPPLAAPDVSSTISTRTPPHTEIDIEMRELETSPSSSPDEPDGTYHRDVVGRDS